MRRRISLAAVVAALAVSCPAAGNCSAGGYYLDAHYDSQAVVVSEVDGHWHPAEEVPGTAALNTNGNAGVLSVSCASPGNCVAGGEYFAAGRRHQNVEEAFVADERLGVWGKAREVAAGLNTAGLASVSSVSCASPGNCVAGGLYDTLHGNSVYVEAFVAGENGGRWGPAEAIPGIAALNGGGAAVTDGVSCATPDHCSAVGQYRTRSLEYGAFVAGET